LDYRIHGTQVGFARNFIGITGMAIGMDAGVVNFGGIIAGSYGFMAIGSALGTGAAVINSTGHVLDGNYGAIFAEGVLATTTSIAYPVLRSARNLTPTERFVFNSMIFKSDQIGQLGIAISTNDLRN